VKGFPGAVRPNRTGGFVSSSRLGHSARLDCSGLHLCGRCRRLFEDRSVNNVPRWMVANLDADVLPDYDMIWDRTKTWEPPESLTDPGGQDREGLAGDLGGERRRGGA
jgi:hypothetical protein